MFKIEFANKLAIHLASSSDNIGDKDFSEQFCIYLNALRNLGEIPGCEIVRIIGVVELAYLIPCREFNIVYVVYKQLNLIRVFIFDIDPLCNFLQNKNLLEEAWRTEEDDLNVYIPQADRPDKILRTLELVNQGFNTSLMIGIQLGHKGKKDEYKARHGSYFCRAAVELKLLTSHRNGKSAYIYDLTSTGHFIANCPDKDTQYRLLAQAMLNFYPLEVIFNEINLGKTALTIELIEELIIQLLYPGDRDCKTIKRRAKCLMRWTLWVARVVQIPIRCTKENCLQLYLPL